MEENMNTAEAMVEAAMSIIMSAGDARVACKQALMSVAKADFEAADAHMKTANEKIAEAHHVQTDAIQGEIRGEKTEHTLLFAHAQDTLMTIYSEINLASQIIKIAKSYDQRLAVLESR